MVVYLKTRKQLRLSWFDYSEPRAYFFTICTFSNQLIFRDTEIADIVKKCWQKISLSYPLVKLDEFVIMPNHVHGILWIKESATQNKIRPKLGTILGSFKSAVSKILHAESLVEGKIWQRNYFERIIRNEEELNSIRKYIIENPIKWDLDRENPKHEFRRGQACLTPTSPIRLLFEPEDIK